MSEQTDLPLGQDYALELEQFHSETRARSEEMAAVRRRIRNVQPRRDRPPLRLMSLGLIGSMAAAALTFTIWPTDDPVPATPQALALSAESWAELQVHEDVTLGWVGQGELEAEGRAHDIDWKSGRLKVSVTPKQGIDLTVRTPEATVSVVGTVFEVRRDTLGTTVTVERGQVEVICAEQTPLMLTADENTHTCQPTTAVGLLNRAQDLIATDPDAAADSVKRGLQQAAPTTDSFAYSGLHYQDARLHRDAGRHAEALHAANASLEGGDPEWLGKAHTLAAESGWMLGQCSEASSHLTWLAAHSSANAEQLFLLAGCVFENDPAAAQKWLENAEDIATDPGLKEKIRSHIERLAP